MIIKIKSSMPIFEDGIEISVEVNDWYEVELESDGNFTVETQEEISIFK